jgi:4-amino-4-deoxy-L-arabinose transferase-like glycosyltransferase
VIEQLEKRPVLVITFVVLGMLLPFLDALEVTIMEARNFISAREMLTDNNWLLTTMNGEPRYEKPPLPTWLTALSGYVFGIKSVWAMRLPAVLMVVLLGSVVITLSRKLTLSPRHSLLNGLISVTSLYVVLIIFEAPWDIYAHAFMLSGIYCLFSNLRSPSGESNILKWVVATLCIGASILSKGPVSLYALFLPFVIAYLIQYRRETSRKKWLPFIITICMGLVIGFSWYIYVRSADPVTFARIAERETGNWTSYNVRPFYYYWSFFVQSGLWTIPAFISLLYPYLKTRVLHRKEYTFTLLWTLLAVVLLSIIPEKKSRYLMPVLIPLAFTIGFYIHYLIRSFSKLTDRRETLPVYFNIGLIGTLIILGGLALLTLGWQLAYLSVLDILPGVFVVLAGVCIIYFLVKKELYKSLLSLVIALVLLVNVGFNERSQFKKYAHQSVKSSSLDNRIETSFKAFENLPALPVYGLNGATPEMVWAAGKKIPRLCKDDELVISGKDSFYTLVFFEDDWLVSETFPDMQHKFMFTLELNTADPASRNYTDRKVASVYLVE